MLCLILGCMLCADSFLLNWKLTHSIQYFMLAPISTSYCLHIVFLVEGLSCYLDEFSLIRHNYYVIEQYLVEMVVREDSK